ncbi:MAG: hypothetical protein SCALA702_22870 [Melioribacteraceae bacterium]|nr:MAG: hypothetical protein SCALA702_22870 [Melioribacteraceae bacterium]
MLAQELPVVPYPQKVEFKSDNLSLGNEVNFSVSESEKSDFIYNKFAGFLAENNVKIDDNAKINVNVKIEKTELPEVQEEFKVNEGYVLSISETGIELSSSTAKGAFNGIMTLIQILENYGFEQVPSLKIVDYPDLEVRGISDDISRGQVSTLENFKRIIDFMAKYKLNTYMPYMEDVIELKSYPQIGKNRGALTREEIKEILTYAESNFIDVIPIFQTLGHYENILLDEDFLEYAEFPGAASLNVSNPKTYEFLENMLVEVFELFPSEYFHMGADESFDVGLGESKHLVDESSIAMVHADHYQKIYDICKKHGKKVIMYGDIILRHPEILERLPKDIIIVDWHYRAKYDYSSTETFNSYGHKYYVSPSVWNFLTTFPTNVNAMPNIEYIIKDGMKNGTSGMINSNWGDYGAETIKELIYFGYAWSSQCSWNISSSDPGKFSGDFTKSFYGINNYSADRIYREFSNTLNQMMWHEVWRHPLLDFRAPVWWTPPTTFSEVGKINWLQWSLPAIKRDIEKFSSTAGKFADHNKIFSMLADMNDWYADKVTNQLLLQELREGASTDFAKAVSQVENLVIKLEDLKTQYKNVWLSYYKPDNLNMIEDKFDRLISYFDEIKVALNQQKLYDPTISSEFIYHPDDGDEKIKEAEFRKVFDLNEKPESVKLQILADTYAELYINGEFVQKLFARRSLSLLVDYGRIKYIDVTKYLKKGENIIEVKTVNYNRSGRAGVNIISEIKSGGNKIMLETNTGWQVRQPNSDKWTFAVSFDYPYTVIAPDFARDRQSWIER